MIEARKGINPKLLLVFDTMQSEHWQKDGKVSQKGIERVLKPMLDSGISFDDVSAINLADTPDKPKASDYKEKANYVRELIETYAYNCCIPVGAGAFEKVAGMKGAAKYFGKTLISEVYEGLKLLPCPSPAQAKYDPGILTVIAEVVRKSKIEMEYPDIREEDKQAVQYCILDTIEKVREFFSWFSKPEIGVFAYDLETTGLNFNLDEITTIQFSHKQGYSYLIPCRTLGEWPAAPYKWKDTEWQEIQDLVKMLFADPGKQIIGHNKKFDDKFMLHHWGVPLQKGRSFDTMIASFLCDENTPNGLKDLTCQLTDMGDYELELEKFKDAYCKKHKVLKKFSPKNPDKPVFSYGMIPFDILAPYALCDTDATIRLYHHFKEEMKKEAQEKTFELVMRINWLLTRFELNGWPINVEYAKELEQKLRKDIAALEIELLKDKNIQKASKQIDLTQRRAEHAKRKVALAERIEKARQEVSSLSFIPKDASLPEKEQTKVTKFNQKVTEKKDKLLAKISEMNEEMSVLPVSKSDFIFNLNSTDQKRVLFFDTMRMPVVKRTKKKQPATDKEAVSIWMRSQPQHKEFLQTLQHYSEMCKFLSTYVVGILRKTVNGRVHGTYNACGAKTGRTSSREPNLQNLPARGDDRKMKLVKAIKKMFEAPEGRTLLGADLSGIEMRWACIVSGDTKLTEIFNGDGLVHEAVAQELFDYITCPRKDIKKLYEFERNSVSKTVQFLSLFGGSGEALAKKVNESIIERQEMAKAKGEILELKEWTKEDGQQVLDNYFIKYRGVDDYIKDTTQFTLEHGYAVSAFGYRRRVPAVNSEDEGVKAQAVRQAVNATIQNPASVSLLLSLCNLQEEIDEKYIDIKLLGAIHDAGYAEPAEGLLLQSRDLLLQHITAPPIPNCPIPICAEAEYGKDWASFSDDFGVTLCEEEDEEDEGDDLEEAA